VSENNRRCRTASLAVRIAESAAGIAGFTGGNTLVQIWQRSGHSVALTTAVTGTGERSRPHLALI